MLSCITCLKIQVRTSLYQHYKKGVNGFFPKSFYHQLTENKKKKNQVFFIVNN